MRQAGCSQLLLAQVYKLAAPRLGTCAPCRTVLTTVHRALALDQCKMTRIENNLHRDKNVSQKHDGTGPAVPRIAQVKQLAGECLRILKLASLKTSNDVLLAL